jgi:hypothetical protein
MEIIKNNYLFGPVLKGWVPSAPLAVVFPANEDQ